VKQKAVFSTFVLFSFVEGEEEKERSGTKTDSIKTFLERKNSDDRSRSQYYFSYFVLNTKLLVLKILDRRRFNIT